MLPILWPGDLLTIRSMDVEQVVPGDIVLVLRDQRFFVHRLIAIKTHRDCRWYVTKGDSLNSNDPPAPESHLLGRVASVRRGNRTFVPRKNISPLLSGLRLMVRHSDRFCRFVSYLHAIRIRKDFSSGVLSRAFYRVCGVLVDSSGGHSHV